MHKLPWPIDCVVTNCPKCFWTVLEPIEVAFPDSSMTRFIHQSVLFLSFVISDEGRSMAGKFNWNWLEMKTCSLARGVFFFGWLCRVKLRSFGFLECTFTVHSRLLMISSTERKVSNDEYLFFDSKTSRLLVSPEKLIGRLLASIRSVNRATSRLRRFS